MRFRLSDLSKNILVFLLLLTGTAFGQDRNAFTAKGHLTGLPDGEIYLAFGTFSKMKADTVRATDGNFVFHDSISEPCYGMLFNHDYSVKVDLFVDKGTLNIAGNVDSGYDVRVWGSPVVDEYAAYNQALLNTRKPVQVVYVQWMNAYKAGDSAKAGTYKAAFFKARDLQTGQENAMREQFIKTHPDSYASAWELLHDVSDKNLAKGKELFEALSQGVKQSEQGKELAQRIATLSRVVVGQHAPGFEQQNTKDKMVSLASYKGKYVLLEFWASWCAPCRAESPNVLKAYKRFKDKGFNVLSVSLDHEKDKWEAAIKKDGLLWTQVSDLKGWKNDVAVLYGINAVPANFLIDPAGKIVAQNLRGDDLNKELEKIFGAR